MSRNMNTAEPDVMQTNKREKTHTEQPEPDETDDNLILNKMKNTTLTTLCSESDMVEHPN